VARIDWPVMFLELKHLELGIQKIAESIDVGRTTLLHWRDNGTEPLHEPGERFIEYWMVVTSKPREQLPLKCPDFDKRRAI
jgi:hypothetical protein